jgi:hypothetical protein
MRIRWFTAEWPTTIRVLASRMRAQLFTEATQEGFLLDRTRENTIEGRFIEKFTYKETIPDPFGQELTFDRIEYRQVHFNIYRDFPQLELRDPPRNLQAFMSKLLAMTDFSMMAAPLIIDVMQWADKLKLALGKAVIIDTVQASAITFAPEVTGTMLLKSRRDVKRAMDEVLAGRPRSIDKARLSWTDDGRPVSVHLGSGASAKLELDGLDLLPVLRASLPKSQGNVQTRS